MTTSRFIRFLLIITAWLCGLTFLGIGVYATSTNEWDKWQPTMSFIVMAALCIVGVILLFFDDEEEKRKDKRDH